MHNNNRSISWNVFGVCYCKCMKMNDLLFITNCLDIQMQMKKTIQSILASNLTEQTKALIVFNQDLLILRTWIEYTECQTLVQNEYIFSYICDAWTMDMQRTISLAFNIPNGISNWLNRKEKRKTWGFSRL